MRKPTERESAEIAALSKRMGSTRFRTLMTDPERRLMRPERLEKLAGGRGRISESEARQLQAIRRNSRELQLLGKKKTTDEQKGRKRKDVTVNRRLRDWLNGGKEKGIPYQDQPADDKTEQLKAIKALRYFGIDPVKGQYYVKKGT